MSVQMDLFIRPLWKESKYAWCRAGAQGDSLGPVGRHRSVKHWGTKDMKSWVEVMGPGKGVFHRWEVGATNIAEPTSLSPQPAQYGLNLTGIRPLPGWSLGDPVGCGSVPF